MIPQAWAKGSLEESGWCGSEPATSYLCDLGKVSLSFSASSVFICKTVKLIDSPFPVVVGFRDHICKALRRWSGIQQT